MSMAISSSRATLPPGAGIDRILIVDDIQEMRQTLRRMLRWAGVREVDLASDIGEARTALEAAKNRGKPYDLIFADQMMPGGSGVELVQEIVARNLIERRHTGLFLLTGVPDLDLEGEAKKSGALAVLEKPISTEKLLAVIQRWSTYRANSKAGAAS